MVQSSIVPARITINTAGGGNIATVLVSNSSASLLTAPYVQFAHGFRSTGIGCSVSDLPSGQILQITDDLGGSATYTACRRSTGGRGGTDTMVADLFCKLANNIPARLAVSSITHSGTTATVTTASSHGLSTGKYVHMEGQLPADYCGAYLVTVTGASTFTYVMPTTPATNAITTGTMNYCRALSLTAAAGSWNDTLPNSKTAANIITDLGTNFDNVTITLTNLKNSAGSTVGSGTFIADMTTAFAKTAPAGGHRTTATGPTICDLTTWMKFVDNVGGAANATLVAYFYPSCLLDSVTGAVTEVQWRVFIDQSLANAAMDFYTFNASVKLGSTVVRSWGLSSTLAVDGKLQSVAPSAVSTSTGQINIPSHGYVGGETVRLTTSGGLPSGWLAATDYGVILIDSSHIAITTNFSENLMVGNASPIIPSTQGTGTHTITCQLHSPYRSRQALSGADGLPDRHTGISGAFSPIAWHVIHDKDYLQTTRLVPPVDLTINLSAPVQAVNSDFPNLESYCFGAGGTLQYAQDAGGAGGYHEYGAGWSDKPLRRLRYCNDRAGYVQALRVDALMIGSWDSMLTDDDTNWRPPVINNGPNRAGASYTGMSAPKPTAWWFHNAVISGFTTPTSVKFNNGLGFFSYSHRYMLLAPLYLMEGRQEIHDMMMHDACNTAIARDSTDVYPTTQQISIRQFLISGTTYYTATPDGNESRTDYFMTAVMAEAVVFGDDSAPEKPYVKDILDDTLTGINFMINTEGAASDPTWLTVGGWAPGEMMKGGPGVSTGSGFANLDSCTGFFMGYGGVTLGYLCRMYPTTNMKNWLTQIATFHDNMYRVAAGKGWIGNSYGFRLKRAQPSATNNELTLADFTHPMVEDSNLMAGTGCILFRTDGTVWGCSAGFVSDVYPQLNELHYLTTSQIDGDQPVITGGPPPELTLYGEYFVVSPSGSYSGWKYATTASGTPISPYSAISSSTLNGAINNSQTSIVTNATLTFGVSPIKLIVVGTEIMQVTAGAGTTSLTVTRGMFGTAAASALNGATIYAPYLCTIFANYHQRVVAFPPTGHAYRITGAAAAAVDGYLTLARASLGYEYLNGIIPITGFNNADAWFNDATVPAGSGPGGFALNNTLMDTVNTSL